MEDIKSSPVESGFLTEDPNSCQPTPSITLESLYDIEEQLKNSWYSPRKPSRFQSSSVYDLDEEPQLSYYPQIHYPSAPDIPESYSKRSEQNPPERREAEARDAPHEGQLFLSNSGKSRDNEEKKKKSLWWLSVPLWVLVCVCVVASIIISVLLGFLLSRGAVKDLGSRGPPCEESWIWVGGRCYYFSDVPKTWNDSREFCSKHGSTLAVLMDQDIKKTVERFREKVNYWIGLSMNYDGRWRWSNGSLYDGSVDTHNVNLLRCAYLNSHLGALDCSTRRQWICVKDSAA